MEFGSFSEIFCDPLLNEFTDQLLDDIDIHDFDDFAADDVHNEQQFFATNEVKHPEFKSEPVGDDSWNKSNHATLEALLKSQPSPSVPPAPDLRSDLSTGTQRENYRAVRNFTNSVNLQRRSSLPITKPDCNPFSEKDAHNKAPSKSRLICEYLEKRVAGKTFPHNTAKLRGDWSNTVVFSVGENVNVTLSHSKQAQSAGCHRIVAALRDSDTEHNSVWSSDAQLGDAEPNGGAQDQFVCDAKGGRRAPHNTIEKRYRASINGRIDELRKILIPYPNADTKINKSAVLRQAINRIKELEEKNQHLRAEVTTLRALCSSGRFQSYNDCSPESGISSLEPSPSASSTLSGLDFGNSTSPSSGTSCGSLFNASVGCMNQSVTAENCATSIENTDLYTTTTTPWQFGLNDLQDVYNTNSSSFMQHAEFIPENRSTYRAPDESLHTPPDLGDCALISDDQQGTYGNVLLPNIVQPGPVSDLTVIHPITHGLPNFNGSDIPVSSAVVNSQLGKRGAGSVHAGPSKVRRHVLPLAPIDNKRRTSEPVLSKPSTLLIRDVSIETVHTSTTPNTFPTVRYLLSSGTLNVEPSTTVQSGVPTAQQPYAYIPSSGFNGVAARTTLCVAALCLIALDPVVLTGRGNTNSANILSTNPSSSRRLLSAFNTFSAQSPSPWSVSLVYLVQWIVALCLCWWACRKPSVSTRTYPSMIRDCKYHTDKYGSKLDAISGHWVEANQALNQASWSLAELRLHLCLSELNEPMSYRFSVAAPVKLTGQVFSRMYRVLDWIILLVDVTYTLFSRLPQLLVCTLSIVPGRPRLSSKCGETQVESSVLTAAEVRLRLLELHLLAPDGRSGDNTLRTGGDSLFCIRLIVACARDFIDSFLHVLRCQHGNGNQTKKSVKIDSLPDDLLFKAGFLLILASTRNPILKFLKCFLLRWTLLASEFLPSRTPWTKWIMNPVVQTMLLTGQLTTNDQVHCASHDGTIEHRLQTSLQRQLTDRCLHAVVGSQRSKLSRLEPLINTLLQVCNVNENTGGSSPSSANPDKRFTAEITTVQWWAQFVNAAWNYRLRSVSSSTRCSHLPLLDAPSAAVLSYPQSGLLAEAVWLAYRSVMKLHTGSESDYVGAQRSSLLLRRFCEQTSEDRIRSSLAEDESNGSVFWILASEVLAVDWVLTVLTNQLTACKGAVRCDSSDFNMGSTMTAFGAGLWVLQQSSRMLGITKPKWVTKQLSYYMTIHRLALGANPVRSRLMLLHSSRSFTNSPLIRTPVTPDRSEDRDCNPLLPVSTDSDENVLTEEPVSTLEDRQFQMRSKDVLPNSRQMRCTPITQSPGQ
ncbi:hypothetical protein PHET_02400 [Paragonimus heterotremus]|uniref:BHLH domain-containing protein n=1 Tax=Paragonimus heterotremus TaxID=100268 RepID=A0A8J4TCL7_9TREM|nr:hypothetical protein PHET_02400 [Paragonimus heterotremus]